MRQVTKAGVMAGILAILVGALVALGAMTALGNGQDTCPEGGGWVKVDDLDGLTYTFDVPDGFTVTENCFKAAVTLVFGTGATVTNTTVVNKNGQLQDISHASFLLVENTEETTTTTLPDTTTTTVEGTTITTGGETTTTTQPDGSTTTVVDDTTTTQAQTTTSEPPTDPTELPYTGISEPFLWVLVGSLLLGAGVAFVLRAGRE